MPQLRCRPKRKPSDMELIRREEKKSNPLPKDHLDTVLVRQGFRCYVCNMPIARYPGCGWKKATLDHDVARALGGANDEQNAKYALCQPCNSSKNRSDMRSFINRWTNLEKRVEEAGGRCPECHRSIWVTSQARHPNRATLYKGTVRCFPCNVRIEQDDRRMLGNASLNKTVR